MKEEMKKLKWGVLSTATIAVEQVIPAIKHTKRGELLAVASRSKEKAEQVAHQFGIPRFYGSYEELLGDREVQSVYIPLPNHLHVEWAIKALRAGKHVLVEKPVAMDADEAQQLLEESQKHPELMVMEAFMYKFHPQWAQVRKMVQEGTIGVLKMIQSSFSFFDDNPGSITNIKEYGGGSLMDVGCYPISISRFLFEAEPVRVISSLDIHPDFEVDVHASGVLEFEMGRTVFFSSIQLTEHQEVKLFGTEGKIEFEIPFNPPKDKSVRVILTKEDGRQEIIFEPCDQYSLQIDAFSKAVLENARVPASLDDAVKNMRVIEAIKESARRDTSIVL